MKFRREEWSCVCSLQFTFTLVLYHSYLSLPLSLSLFLQNPTLATFYINITCHRVTGRVKNPVGVGMKNTWKEGEEGGENEAASGLGRTEGGGAERENSSSVTMT